MKKVFLVVILGCCIVMTAVGQDVIFTNENTVINAKILEVSAENISYKKYDYQDGATFIIHINKIDSIIWQNGDIDRYVNLRSNKLDLPYSEKNEDVLPFINREKKLFYISTGQIYNREQLKLFLTEKNLHHIWKKYNRGQNLLERGWTLIATGVFLEIIGMGLYYSGGYDTDIAGFAICWIGGLLETVGIPVAIVGAVKKNNAINDYNSLYGGKPHRQYSQNITFKTGFIGNGIGFSLNF